MQPFNNINYFIEQLDIFINRDYGKTTKEKVLDKFIEDNFEVVLACKNPIYAQQLEQLAGRVSSISPLVGKKLRALIEGHFPNKLATDTTTSPDLKEEKCLIGKEFTQLTPLAFWTHVSEVLQKNPSIEKIEIEGQGIFDRRELQTLIDLETRLPPQKLRALVEKLAKTSFSLKEYKRDDYLPLHLHIIAGREDCIAEDLKKLHVDTTDKRGLSALQWACYLGHVDCIKELLNAEADLHFGTIPPLKQAVLGEEYEIVKLLLAADKSLHSEKDLGLALNLAANRGLHTIVKLLLEHGADVNFQDKDGLTPLMWAADYGRLTVLKILLQSGADTAISSEEGETVLTILTHKRPPYWKFMKLLTKTRSSPSMLNYLQDYTGTKRLSHAFSFKGRSVIQGRREISLEGAQRELAANTMARSILKFAEDCPALLDKASAEDLAEALQFSSNWKSHTPLQTMQRIKQGKPTFILTGYEGHAVTVLIWKDFFILCDRGGNSKSPLLIHRFDPTKLTENSIQLLQDTAQDVKKYEELIFKTLPEELSFTQTENEVHLQELVELLMQTVGNCSWEATEGALKAYLLLNKLQSTSDSRETATLKKSVDMTFTSWLLFQQMVILDKFMKPTVDADLISRSLAVLRGAQYLTPEAFNDQLTQRLANLEAKYLAVASIRDAINFRTSKAVYPVLQQDVKNRSLFLGGALWESIRYAIGL